MGYPLDLFLNQELADELTCTICHDVMKDPLVSEPCQHLFCTTCIYEWSKTSKTCPIDRTPIRRLVKPPRSFINLYNLTEMKCGFDGCAHRCNLGSIEAHYNNTDHDAITPCAHNCGGLLKMSEVATHNCILYLRAQLDVKDLCLDHKDEEIEKLQKEIGKKDKKIERYRDMGPVGGITWVQYMMLIFVMMFFSLVLKTQS